MHKTGFNAAWAEFDKAWKEYFKNRPHPKTDEELRAKSLKELKSEAKKAGLKFTEKDSKISLK